MLPPPGIPPWSVSVVRPVSLQSLLRYPRSVCSYQVWTLPTLWIGFLEAGYTESSESGIQAEPTALFWKNLSQGEAEPDSGRNEGNIAHKGGLFSHLKL